MAESPIPTAAREARSPSRSDRGTSRAECHVDYGDTDDPRRRDVRVVRGLEHQPAGAGDEDRVRSTRLADEKRSFSVGTRSSNPTAATTLERPERAEHGRARARGSRRTPRRATPRAAARWSEGRDGQPVPALPQEHTVAETRATAMNARAADDVSDPTSTGERQRTDDAEGTDLARVPADCERRRDGADQARHEQAGRLVDETVERRGRRRGRKSALSRRETTSDACVRLSARRDRARAREAPPSPRTQGQFASARDPAPPNARWRGTG